MNTLTHERPLAAIVVLANKPAAQCGGSGLRPAVGAGLQVFVMGVS